jgi:peptidoglycan hydrolase CwlO-like protein
MIDSGASVSLAFLFSLIAAIGVIYNIFRNRKQDTSEAAKGIMKANLKLDELCQTTRETRLDIKAMESKIDELAKKQIEHELRLQNVEKKVEEL